MNVWWCEEHRTDSVEPSTDANGEWLGIDRPPYCWYWFYLRDKLRDKPCRMVEMRLTPKDALVIQRMEHHESS
jgi:hypothetical protein